MTGLAPLQGHIPRQIWYFTQHILMVLALSTADFFLFTIIDNSPAKADGFRILDHSASATGQGAAFAAQANDPSAIYYNPAGMVQLRGVQLSGTLLLVGGETNFNGPFGSTQGNLDGSVAIPPLQFY